MTYTALYRIVFLIPVLLVFSVYRTHAQPRNREIVNQSTEWFIATANIELSKRLTATAEGHLRYVGSMEPMFYITRACLDVKLNDHFSVTPLGHIYVWSYQYGKQPTPFKNNEHRLWQQVLYKHAIGRFQFDHRLRMEERFIQVHAVNPDGLIVNEGYDNKQYRVRYRFMARMPLNAPAIDPDTWFLCASDEAFISWGKNVTFHEPDQNRLYAGAGYRYGKKLTLQAGFIYQMWIKFNGAQQENNIGAQAQVTYNISLLKADPK